MPINQSEEVSAYCKDETWVEVDVEFIFSSTFIGPFFERKGKRDFLLLLLSLYGSERGI